MSGEVQFKRRSERIPPDLRKLTVRVPGSSANLGPGFDALALAYQLYCRLDFRILEKNDPTVPLITLKGCLSDGLPKDQNNLIYTVLSNLWRNDPEILQRVRISIESEIPLGKGVGSSAAAITGAVWAANVLCGEMPDNGKILSAAAELEGHADNAAASLLGGLVVSARSTKTRSIVSQKLLWPKEWRCLVTVPSYVLSTKKSRSVLPQQYSKHDAVHNIQKVSLLLAAVQNRDEEALQEALHDRLHEPYRSELVPQLGAIRKHLSDLPVLGSVLSGAGSSVLTIVHERQKQPVLSSLKAWAEKHSPGAEVLDLDVDLEGLKVSYE
ncbi:MAG: homoserine kinase [Candidatus Obscuribacterales bacterium]|nr:homoserine kinase [Candidatus Obscuribacterales bacterium]